ncbi:UDP-N-acetylglucosamine transferase subunit ALG13 homolog [Chrysoperla carnea]|uniref:UDP-N-acetylglucosamine transferase subunit ALG13 homolog n=1 Tax=Chrysoperla carnea TaxID=189513 RepID=UPI001D07AAF1|nr:UDP-N-acetylglucosamine transferase subunit ALG13 homolog [Chrysoperla carnea]
MGKQVFVTVGTTEFNLLIKTVSNVDILLTLKELGFTKVIFQIGKGSFTPSTELNIDGISVEYYRYKDSIQEDILESDLIISHAGAGTCLEVLQAGKTFLAVINEELMDNHQLELAEEFHKLGYLHYCTCDKLYETLKTINSRKLKPYPKGNKDKFVKFLNEYMGV